MTPVRVLFLCTGNSARSIIGQALLKAMGGDGFEAFSAGTAPKGINPLTVKALEQVDIDISGERSKHMSEYEGQSLDYVITVCDEAAEQCPLFPGDPARIHWNFPDPAAVQGTEIVTLAAFQETVRGMQQRLSTFIPVAKHATVAGQDWAGTATAGSAPPSWHLLHEPCPGPDRIRAGRVAGARGPSTGPG